MYTICMNVLYICTLVTFTFNTYAMWCYFWLFTAKGVVVHWLNHAHTIPLYTHIQKMHGGARYTCTCSTCTCTYYIHCMYSPVLCVYIRRPELMVAFIMGCACTYYCDVIATVASFSTWIVLCIHYYMYTCIYILWKYASLCATSFLIQT